MGGTEEEVKQKHQDGEGKEGGEKGEDKVKDKNKKKDKESKEKGEGDNHEDKEKSGQKEKKKKNPEDKKDPSKLKQKLEKLNAKIRNLAVKREDILKSIEEAEKNPPAPANPTKEDEPSIKQD